MKKQDLTNTAFNAAIMDKKLIRGVLKSFYITQQHSHYDDYYQECLLAYADAYCAYAKQLTPTITRQNYLYTKLRQRVIDLIRKSDCYDRYCNAGEPLTEPLIDHQAYLDQSFMIHDLLDHLTPAERTIFLMIYLQHYTAKETGQKLNMSKSALYRWRHSLEEKIKNYLTNKWEK